MNQSNLKLCSEIIDDKYIKIASNSLNARENLFKVLFSQRCLPEQGFDDLTIEHLLNVFATMDTNNFINKVGVGERESRIHSNLVAKRNFYMGHGIGRSGDLTASQPKAAGSSLIAKLTKHLVKDALKVSNYQINELICVPMATGMSLTLCLLTLQSQKPTAKYVLWPRIDQKTCLKCIQTANLIPIVIDTVIQEHAVTTDLNLLQKKIQDLGAENILCVLSTTSCFAPRIPDNVAEIARICKQVNLYHLVNNAYGIQCNKIANLINQGLAIGGIDLIVSSTDKNFMVPVGGALIYGNNKKLIKSVGEMYPGRASAAPILDLFITLLSLGKQGYLQLLKQRTENYQYFLVKLKEITQKYKECVLETKQNSISIAISLQQKELDKNNQEEVNDLTKIGAILYAKKVMGSRVITNKKVKKVCGIEFQNYGSHCNSYFTPYLTVACAIGMTKEEIDQFLGQFEKVYKQ